MKISKSHKCKACGGEFQRRNSMQKACSTECAIALVNKAKIKAAAEEAKTKARDAKAKIKAMKTLPELRKEAQSAFNAYIRARAVRGFFIARRQKTLDTILFKRIIQHIKNAVQAKEI